MKKYHQISETVGCTGLYETGIYNKTLSSLPDMYKMISILTVMLLAITFVLLSLADSLQAQERVRFSHLTTTDGLSQSTGRVIIQDYEGYMWFGTLDGLNRYDSSPGQFDRFLQHSGETGATGGHIKTIYEDGERFWIGTQGGGLILFNRESGAFQSWKYNPGDPGSLSDNSIFAVLRDRWGRLWVGTENGGLKLFDRNDFTIKSFSERDGLANNTVHAIQDDGRGYLWLSTNQGISRFNKETKLFTDYSLDDGLQSLEYNANSSFRDRDGYLYFGGVSGFNRFHPEDIKANTDVPPVVLTGLRIFNRSVEIGDDSPLQHHISRPGNHTPVLEDDLVLSVVVCCFRFDCNRGLPLQGSPLYVSEQKA